MLKLYKIGFPKQAIDEEYLNSQYVYALGAAAPEPYERVENGERYGIVFQKVDGTTVLQQIVNDPPNIEQYAYMLAETHVQLHQMSADRMERKQKAALAQQIAKTNRLTRAEKDAVRGHLERLPDGMQLCHGDYHPGNVIAGRKSWVIDWMSGMSGHPCGDVARTWLLLTFGTVPDEMPEKEGKQLNLMRRRLTEIYLNNYVKLSGATQSGIEEWLLPMAAARLDEWIPEAELNTLTAFVQGRLR
ncbi:phosphotransferase [Paenibacillus sp. J5C_2022]|nr:aminoglycoside phosphotransferase family protein [Paenibacillus sp. J5C2022]MCU6707436.1 phosphotransferase [Paenibacillus sp. J5C2022]